MFNLEKETWDNRVPSKKQLAKALGASLVSISSACIGVSLYVGLSLTRRTKKPLAEKPENHGIDYEDVTFMSMDGFTRLSGWLIPSTVGIAKRTIICSHGYGGNRHHGEFLLFSKKLAALGYQVLLFDYRNAGESDGKMTTIGAKEKYDLLGAIEYIKTIGDTSVVLYGISMGAATSLLAAGMTKDVEAVIADSPFSDLEDYLKENLPVWTKLPKYPFTSLIMTTIPKVFKVDIQEASPREALETIYPRPVLFIHGNGDSKIPYTESVKMAETHPDTFTIWVPEGTEHVMGYVDYPIEYLAKIVGFLKNLDN